MICIHCGQSHYGPVRCGHNDYIVTNWLLHSFLISRLKARNLKLCNNQYMLKAPYSSNIDLFIQGRVNINSEI